MATLVSFTDLAELRKQADKHVSDNPGKYYDPKEQDIGSLAHELSVYQVELEMQNDELRGSQEKLEELHSRYFDLYEYAPVGYLTIDVSGIISDANIIATRLLGIDRHLLLRSSLLRFVATEYRRMFSLHTQAVLDAPRTIQTCELLLKRGLDNEEVFPATLQSTAVTVNGHTEIRTVLTDVTDLKQAQREAKTAHEGVEIEVKERTADLQAEIEDHKTTEDALRLSEEEAMAIVNASDSAILLLDAKGVVLVANRAVVERLGVELSDIVNRPIFGLLPEHVAAKTKTIIEEVVRAGEPITFEDEQMGMHFHNKMYPVRSEHGVVTKVVVYSTDITGRKRAETELCKSEERFRAFVAASSGAVYRMSPDWNHMLFLDGRNFISDKVEPNSTWLEKYVHPDDQPHVTKAINQAIRTKSAFELEHRVTRVDGRFGWTLSRAIPILNERGDIEEWFGTASDITDRKRMEEELRSLNASLEQRIGESVAETRRAFESIRVERQRLYDVLEALPVRVCLLTPDYHVPFANRAFREGFGEAEGRCCYDYCFGFSEPCSFCEALKPLETGQPHRWMCTSPDGKGTIDAYDFPFTDVDGSRMILEMNIDITEQRRLEEQLRQVHKMEAVGTLAGGIAHDFNNMLAVIMGNAELAIDDDDLEAVRHNLKQILVASKRSRDLVRQILTFSRKNGGNGKITRISPVVEETYDLLRASLPSTISMELKLRAKKEVTVPLDSSQIQQILVNLANNAAHAMRDKGGSLTISLSAISRPRSLVDDGNPTQYVKMTVKDTGTGITRAVQRRMYEPFFTTKAAGQGTGMGLSVIYGIINASGGTIDVESELGKGSTFVVLLPRTDAQSVAEDDEGDIVACGLNQHVLFVDDEPSVLEVAKGTLERLGCRVTAVSSGSEALKLFKKNPNEFDLVITDQTMPEMTGVALGRRLLVIKEDARVILCTGYSEILSEEKAKDSGIRDFVMKPLTKRELAQAIRKVLEEDQT